MMKIGGYLVDASLTEEPTYEAETTRYPAESGSDFTDLTINAQVSLSVEFIVSDSPIGEVAKSRQGGVIPSREARDAMMRLRDSREPFTVECDSGIFDRMVFKSLSFPRDGETGAALTGTATLERIDVREMRRIAVRAAAHRPARAVAGKPLWFCPFNTRVSYDDEFNVQQGCVQVERRKDGIYYLSGPKAGKKLTPREVTDFSNQELDDNKPYTYYDVKSGTLRSRLPASGPGERSVSWPSGKVEPPPRNLTAEDLFPRSFEEPPTTAQEFYDVLEENSREGPAPD